INSKVGHILTFGTARKTIFGIVIKSDEQPEVTESILKKGFKNLRVKMEYLNIGSAALSDHSLEDLYIRSRQVSGLRVLSSGGDYFEYQECPWEPGPKRIPISQLRHEMLYVEMREQHSGKHDLVGHGMPSPSQITRSASTKKTCLTL
ncbi:hypothetical protein KM043_018825, partial [Ampulex compressa]